MNTALKQWASVVGALGTAGQIILTGYVLDSSGCGIAAFRVAGALRHSSRFGQRDEGVPRRPGVPPYLGYCRSNYLSQAHTQHVLFCRGPGQLTVRDFGIELVNECVQLTAGSGLVVGLMLFGGVVKLFVTPAGGPILPMIVKRF